MRLFPLLLLCFAFSCNNGPAEKKITAPQDSLKQGDELVSSPAEPPRLLKDSVAALADALGWRIVSDSIAQWPGDVFEYFIADKRKADPNYPYITTLDLKGDGKESVAVLVKEKTNGEYQLLIVEDLKDPGTKIHSWKDDIDICAISTYKKTGKEKVKMKGDGINVEYFEKAAFVIYWNGTELKRFYTAD